MSQFSTIYSSFLDSSDNLFVKFRVQVISYKIMMV